MMSMWYDQNVYTLLRSIEIDTTTFESSLALSSKVRCASSVTKRFHTLVPQEKCTKKQNLRVNSKTTDGRIAI